MTQRILIADDQEASRKGLAALVATWGYEVEDAGDGDEALAKAIEHNPAVVITDLVMPKRDGLGLLKALQEELPFTMVIILTAHGTIETAGGATKDGAYDYLTKPVDVARLRLLVEKAIEKGEALREVNVLRRRVKAGRGPARGHQQGDAGGVPPDRSRRADLRAGAHLGRERHRQGAGRAHPSRAVAAEPGAVRRRQLRGDPRHPPRERDLR